MAYGSGTPSFDMDYINSVFKDPNFQRLLAGLGKAVGGQGIGGQMAGAAGQAVRREEVSSEAARQAKIKQLRDKAMLELLSRYGKQPVQQSGSARDIFAALGGLGKQPDKASAVSSAGWLDSPLMPREV